MTLQQNVVNDPTKSKKKFADLRCGEAVAGDMGHRQRFGRGGTTKSRTPQDSAIADIEDVRLAARSDENTRRLRTHKPKLTRRHSSD